MKTSIGEGVAETLRAVAAEAVLPRFNALAESDVRMKAHAEPVTVADQDAERLISRSLRLLLPTARVVGEEACAHDPTLLRDMDAGLIWVIDPIDGTANYAAGRAPFAMMVALLDRGEVVGSWILDPLNDCLARAERGCGAWIDGERVTTSRISKPLADMQGIVSGAFIPPECERAVTALRSSVGQASPTARCAGHEYPLVASGWRDFALYWRTLVWDHAAGALLLNEAGGRVCHLDGGPYRPSQPRRGLVLAGNTLIAEEILSVLSKQGAH